MPTAQYPGPETNRSHAHIDSSRTPTGSRKEHTPSACVYGRADAGRARIESCIAQRFREVHGARVEQFMPFLLTLEREDTVVAAMGLRPAVAERLFIEQYLDHPAETAITRHLAAPQSRGGIMEIGNLVSTVPGASSLLFVVAAELLCARGYDCAVFNATQAVQKVLHGLGFPFSPLCTADPARLQGQAASWGNYYATPSTVIAVSPAAACRALDPLRFPADTLAPLIGQALARSSVVPGAPV